MVDPKSLNLSSIDSPNQFPSYDAPIPEIQSNSPRSPRTPRISPRSMSSSLLVSKNSSLSTNRDGSLSPRSRQPKILDSNSPVRKKSLFQRFRTSSPRTSKDASAFPGIPLRSEDPAPDVYMPSPQPIAFPGITLHDESSDHSKTPRGHRKSRSQPVKSSSMIKPSKPSRDTDSPSFPGIRFHPEEGLSTSEESPKSERSISFSSSIPKRPEASSSSSPFPGINFRQKPDSNPEESSFARRAMRANRVMSLMFSKSTVEDSSGEMKRTRSNRSSMSQDASPLRGPELLRDGKALSFRLILVPDECWGGDVNLFVERVQSGASEAPICHLNSAFVFSTAYREICSVLKLDDSCFTPSSKFCPPGTQQAQFHFQIQLLDVDTRLNADTWKLYCRSFELTTTAASEPEPHPLLLIQRSNLSLSYLYIHYLRLIDTTSPTDVLEEDSWTAQVKTFKVRLLFLDNLPILLSQSKPFCATFVQHGGLSALLDCLLRTTASTSESFHQIIISALKAAMMCSVQSFLLFASNNRRELIFRLISAITLDSSVTIRSEAMEILIGICQHHNLFRPTLKSVTKAAKERKKKSWEELLSLLDITKVGCYLTSLTIQFLSQLLLISPNKKLGSDLLIKWRLLGLDDYLSALNGEISGLDPKQQNQLVSFLRMFSNTIHKFEESTPTLHAADRITKSGSLIFGVSDPSQPSSSSLQPHAATDMSPIRTVEVTDLAARFEVLAYIAKGAFGRVYKVKELASGRVLALKDQNKHDIIEQNMTYHCSLELDILQATRLECPYLVEFHSALQTPSKVFIFMEYLPGGSLWDLLRLRQSPFPELEARFYAGEILLGLECLHNHDFVYRDLKLENLLLDLDGHLRLSDFGLSARQLAGERIHSFSGTAHYLAPEILTDLRGEIGHTRAVDWWAFGIILHILLTLESPFWSESYASLFELIKNQPLDLSPTKYPSLSPPTLSLMDALLTKSPEERLGSQGVLQVKSHSFFDGYDFNLRHPPPMLPTPIDESPVPPGLHPFSIREP